MIAAAALVQRLRTVGSDLPRALAEQIVARGDETLPLLLPLLDGRAVDVTPAHAAPNDPCDDCGALHDDFAWARLHAVDLLAEIGDPRAIDVMTNVLATTAPDEPIHDKIVECLPSFGGPALEPILRTLAQTPKDSDAAESLSCVLSALGVRDDRILRALIDLSATRTRAAAVYLAEYGDPAACPALLALIERELGGDAARLEWLEVIDAYTSLGGELSEAIKARL